MNRQALKLIAASLLLLPAGQIFSRAQDGAGCGLPPSRKLDEYGELSRAEAEARLDKLASALDAEPKDTKGFIVAYAGRGARAGEALRRANAAKDYLVEKSRLDNSRLNTLDCGRRESPATELWLTPAGAAPPLCSPTVSPAEAPPKGGGARRATRRRG